MKRCPNPTCPYLLEHGIAAEYEDSVENCLDCGMPLVSGLTPAPPPKETAPSLPNLVIIQSVAHPAEADLIKARLEAAAIPVFLKDYETINATRICWAASK